MTAPTSLAHKARTYISARDAARAADRRDAARAEKIEQKLGAFIYNGVEIHSLAQIENHRPCEPMGDAALAETIEKIRVGNEKARAEYPEKRAAFERALAKAKKHFETLAAELASAGLKDDPDLSERWGEPEAMELDAFATPVRSPADAAAFVRLLQEHFRQHGVDDLALEIAIPARLAEIVNLLERGQ